MFIVNNTTMKVKVFVSSLVLIICFTPSNVCAANAYFIINSDCSSTYACADKSDISVICQNSKCICDPRLGIYDPLRYQCVGRANHACLGELCTRNSGCDAGTSTCNCLPGYEFSSDGRCVHKFNETCEENEDCRTGLSCYDGICECRFPSHQYYHAENETCYSIAHSWDRYYHESASSKQLGQHQSAPHDQITVQTHSSLLDCVELLLLIMQIVVLVVIAVFLWRIHVIVKDIIKSFKIHGYFLRSSLERRPDAPMQVTSQVSLLDAKL